MPTGGELCVQGRHSLSNATRRHIPTPVSASPPDFVGASHRGNPADRQLAAGPDGADRSDSRGAMPGWRRWSPNGHGSVLKAALLFLCLCPAVEVTGDSSKAR